jgi:endoribonuclease LACTB2
MTFKKSVSAIFKWKNQIFSIRRQDYLTVFPGYTAFPGGKVDRADSNCQAYKHSFLEAYEPSVVVALFREVKEEINIDLVELFEKKKINSFQLMATALTPEFNPYRFETHFFVIELSEKIDFKVDEGEIELGEWIELKEILKRYHRAELLAVPPTVKLWKALESNEFTGDPLDVSLPYDSEIEVPMIESVYGVKQFLPLSNTFPPAKRTNCFLIGDARAYLIDPSPKDDIEYQKLKRSIKDHQVNALFLSHHHPDHHERAPELAKELGVPVGMSEITKRLLLESYGKDYLNGLEIEIFKEGDILTRSLGVNVEVLWVPGHDEGQLALAPVTKTWFFVGDLVQSVGTVVIGGKHGDMAKYFKSLNRVIQYSPQFILPSHGIALGGVHKIEMTLKHRQHREDQICELLKQGKKAEDILGVIYEGLDSRLERYALATIKAHIVKIQA